jgi:hypothetical protein
VSTPVPTSACDKVAVVLSCLSPTAIASKGSGDSDETVFGEHPDDTDDALNTKPAANLDCQQAKQTVIGEHPDDAQNAKPAAKPDFCHAKRE